MDYQNNTISENLAYFLNRIYILIDVKDSHKLSPEEYRVELNKMYT